MMIPTVDQAWAAYMLALRKEQPALRPLHAEVVKGTAIRPQYLSKTGTQMWAWLTDAQVAELEAGRR